MKQTSFVDLSILFVFWMFLVLLAVLTQTIVSFGSDNRGVSWIGQMCSARSDCGVVTDTYKNVPIINAGWLYGTFNPNGCKCSGVLLRDPRPKRIRISICNSTCFPERGRRCQKHECFAGMNSRQATRAILNGDSRTFARIDRTIGLAKNDMAKAVGPTEWLIKPCLECTISPAARRKLNEYVALRMGSEHRYVDNPVGGKCFTDMLCELHGNAVGDARTLVDLDGVSYSQINQRRFWELNSGALMALAWKPCHNAIRSKVFIPPTQRTRFCSRREMTEINKALRGNV